MTESVELQKLALATSVMKRRSGKVFVRLEVVRTCEAKIVCELNMKWKAEKVFKIHTGGWQYCHSVFSELKLFSIKHILESESLFQQH